MTDRGIVRQHNQTVRLTREIIDGVLNLGETENGDVDRLNREGKRPAASIEGPKYFRASVAGLDMRPTRATRGAIS
jgi:hypothetical protein